MKQKKNAVITFRTEDWIKERLQQIAEDNNWSVAQVVEILCKNYLADPEPHKIIVRTEELKSVINKVSSDGYQALQLETNLRTNEEETDIIKYLSITALESGGFIGIADYDSIDQMTEDEILDIP